jgi:PASTA domain
LLPASSASATAAHRNLNCPRGVLAGALLASTRRTGWADARASSRPVSLVPGVAARPVSTNAGSVGESPWLGPQQPGQGKTSPTWIGQPPPPAPEAPTQPAWGPPPGRPPQGWGPPPPPPQRPSGEGVRSFLGRHPLAFFGGILLALVLIGAMFGGTDDNAEPTSQGAAADTTSYTLPTVTRTEASSSTSPPTTTADVEVPKLVGLTARKAKRVLADQGLHWRLTYKTTSRYPSGTVMSQSKQTEGDAWPGATITLVIAKAPPGTSPPTTEPAPPPPSPQSDCHSAYPGDCLPPPPPDLDCADIGHRVEVDHRCGDPHRLDADGDGIGCDSWG